MSRDASITLDFGDDTYVFRLGYGELVELQESLDMGPWYLLAMFNALGQMLTNPEPLRGLGVKAPREVIRIGLIGGGFKPNQALMKVRTYVDPRPPDEYVGVAYQVLLAALSGAPDADEVKKNQEQPLESMTSPTEKSDLPQSTEPERPSVSRRSRSRK